MADLEEAISLYREALELQPHTHQDRSSLLNNLASSLMNRYRRTGTMADLDEVISLHREALDLQPSPHLDRSSLLNNLGRSLLNRYRRMGTMADLKEAISMHREALELHPSPHSTRSGSLWNLSMSLLDMYKETHTLPHLQEAITHCEELLDSHYPVGHENRVETLNHLASLLQKRFNTTNRKEDQARIKMLRKEARQLLTSTSAVPPVVGAGSREKAFDLRSFFGLERIFSW